MRLKYGIAIAGAHGKTTTTSMTASVLAAAGLDPTFVVGGRVNHIGSTARLGRGEYMVVEADESDRTFLLLAPVVAVVTTIDREHLDTYKSLEEIQEIFTQFVNRVPFYGAAVLCLDEPNVQAILPQREAPGDYLWHLQPGRSSHQRHRTQWAGKHVPPDLSRRRPRQISFERPSGNPQRAQRCGCRCRALYLERSRGPDSRGPRRICRGGPAVRRQRRHQQHHVDRRLRPSSRPKFAPRWKRRAAAISTASSCSSSRTGTRARSISGTISAAPSIRPTWSC